MTLNIIFDVAVSNYRDCHLRPGLDYGEEVYMFVKNSRTRPGYFI